MTDQNNCTNCQDLLTAFNGVNAERLKLTKALAEVREVMPCGHLKACLVPVTATLANGSIDNTPVCGFCAELEAVEEKLGDLREKIRVLAEALKAILDKMDIMEKPLLGLCTLGHIHGMPYTGPNWKDEYESGRALLSTLDPPASVKE